MSVLPIPDAPIPDALMPDALMPDEMPSPDQGGTTDVLAAAERVFATAIRDFIAELCLLDGGILIGWVKGARHGNIADLVASSAEPFFKEATIAYADGADVRFDWGRSLTVVLDMEFVTAPVTVFFKLVLDGVYVGVAIQRILADHGPGFCLDGFASALAEARLAPPAR